MRPITAPYTGYRPSGCRECSGVEIRGRGGTWRHLIQPALDVFDERAGEPVRIWNRIGRRPILAAGNSNGDDEMLMYSGGQVPRRFRLLVLHDDADREFDYTAGAERALEHAQQFGWTVVSMKNDWRPSSVTDRVRPNHVWARKCE